MVTKLCDRGDLSLLTACLPLTPTPPVPPPSPVRPSLPPSLPPVMPSQKANKENQATQPRARAKWQPEDDARLVECLEHQKSLGNQSDSGFKSVTWTYAATELNKIRTVGGDKTANGCKDHWQQMLKPAYVDIDWLLHKVSGFGWDSTRDMVTAEESVWKALIASHPKYGVWQHRPFPLFNSIAELVGGRTADGRDSLDITEEESDNFEAPLTVLSSASMIFHPLTGPDDDQSDVSDSQPDPGPVLTQPVTLSQLKTPPPSQTPAPRKRAASPELDRTSSISKRSRPSGPSAMLDVSESLSAIAKAFSQAQEDSSASAITLTEHTTPSRRARAIQQAEKDDSLSLRDRVRLICLFRRDQAVADTFLAITDPDIRSEYISAELGLQNSGDVTF